MSGEKPTYKELSEFGKCVAYTHTKKSMAESVSRTAPPQSAGPEARKRHEEFAHKLASRSEVIRDAVLEITGIDLLVTDPELVESCSTKLPKPTPGSLKRAARATRI